MMRIEANLCHVDDNKVIVRVEGWIDNNSLGSALGQGSSVDLAEDKAIARLKFRLNNNKNITPQENPNKDIDISERNKSIAIQIKGNKNHINKQEEHIDWSTELTEVDSEIKRLGWSKDDEIIFLKKLGYNNRNKITNYQELIKYLKLLKDIDLNSTNKINELNDKDLIKESDIILNDLSWDNQKGREYLIKEFNVSSRKELNVTQLKSFINKLKSIKQKVESN